MAEDTHAVERAILTDAPPADLERAAEQSSAG